ncbi:hypothetical protein [Sagittula sp. S175]|uniref:hypothetical protein n=1 Tax=Sagittula sp. S175 TaxID=3415129 RepID=UPI003C79E4B8
MRIGAVIAAIVAIVLVGFGIYMIDIDQTQEARLPDVEVNVEDGQMPKFDAEVGDVDVVEEEVTVTVPKLEVTPPEEENVAQN